ncbi:hypothetical protein ACH4VM_05025 [Streptomyces sp. NPDC020792]|uniref:hypothetical protein n=1 Tax=Streptomyces sp. NPDC020792 TaxID=3365089 RepID=UPI0037900431
MASRTVRGAVIAIISTAVAAAGLLATGGSASAATYPSSSQSGVVSAVRVSDHHKEDRHNHHGSRHWTRHDKHDGDRARTGEGRRQWVLDQLRWADGHGHTSWDSLKHHDASHR